MSSRYSSHHDCESFLACTSMYWSSNLLLTKPKQVIWLGSLYVSASKSLFWRKTQYCIAIDSKPYGHVEYTIYCPTVNLCSVAIPLFPFATLKNYRSVRLHKRGSYITCLILPFEFGHWGSYVGAGVIGYGITKVMWANSVIKQWREIRDWACEYM